MMSKVALVRNLSLSLSLFLSLSFSLSLTNRDALTCVCRGDAIITYLFRFRGIFRGHQNNHTIQMPPVTVSIQITKLSTKHKNKARVSS
jgi:hypothetical protein